MLFVIFEDNVRVVILIVIWIFNVFCNFFVLWEGNIFINLISFFFLVWIDDGLGIGNFIWGEGLFGVFDIFLILILVGGLDFLLL